MTYDSLNDIMLLLTAPTCITVEIFRIKLERCDNRLSAVLESNDNGDNEFTIKSIAHFEAHDPVAKLVTWISSMTIKYHDMDGTRELICVAPELVDTWLKQAIDALEARLNINSQLVVTTIPCTVH